MLRQTVDILTTSRVILASSSPRRCEIIQKLDINAEIVPSMYDENLDRSGYEGYGEYVQDLAKYKVQEVYDRLKDDPVPPSLIIGADTIVTMDDIIYGKPKNKLDAFEMLSSLANKEHIVYTGVCFKTPKTEITFYESAKVKFGDISEEQIQTYIESGEPLDKAGGYGLQGIGGCLVERIDGDFYTIMGLPMYSMTKRLNKLYAKYS